MPCLSAVDTEIYIQFLFVRPEARDKPRNGDKEGWHTARRSPSTAKELAPMAERRTDMVRKEELRPAG